MHESTTGQMEEEIQLRSNANASLAGKLAAGGVTPTEQQKQAFTAGLEGMAFQSMSSAN